MKKIFLLAFSGILFSCSQKEKVQEHVEAISEITESTIETSKGTIEKAKDLIFESDEIKNNKRSDYLNSMIAQYSDYRLAMDFFDDLNNNYLLEPDGDLYRVIESTVEDGASKVYNYEDKDLIKYIYITNYNFYIYTFKLEKKNVLSCIGVRRIGNRFFKSEMHDLLFIDDKLSKEDYKGKYSTKLYTQDDLQFFNYSSKVNGDKVTNIFNLGPKKDF